MSEDTKSFQICYEGVLTPRVAAVMRRLGAVPNFDSSWEVELPARRRSAVLLRYLRHFISDDVHLLVARMNPTRSRQFLLIRYGWDFSFDHEPLHRAISSLGNLLDLPFRSTFVVDSRDRREIRLIGEELGATSSGAELMVTGIDHDFAVCNWGLSRLLAAHELGTDDWDFVAI